MDFAQLNLINAIPEIALLTLLCFILLADLFIDDSQRGLTYVMSLLTLVVVAIAQIWVAVMPLESHGAFGDMFLNDKIATFAKLVMYALTFMGFVYGRRYLAHREIFKGEYYTLTLFALLGMNFMVSANHFLLLFIGLELLSLALYALIALRRDDAKASEAALKYFILGSLATCIFLYGVSLVYGATSGALFMHDVVSVLYAHADNSVLTTLGLIFIVVGLAFKLGTVPFHMWVPDVYEGAPTAIVAFIGSVTKMAAMVFAFRIVITGMGPAFGDWSAMFIILAVASLLVGNLAAIMQTNIKRMLAYSTVSHMGFVLLAFVGNGLKADSGLSGSLMGMSAGMYYVLTYALMSMVAFGVLIALSNKDHECEDISDLAGLNQTHPWYAFLMLLAIFSMAGIPPLMGFYAKFYVIISLLAQGHIAVSIFAMLMSLVGAFYYLRVVKVMYFDEATRPKEALDFSIWAKILLGLNALLLLLWGIMPEMVLEWCSALFAISA